MAQRFHAEQWQAHAAKAQQLHPLYVVCGDEELLHIEACDALRSAAQRLGFNERQQLQLDAQSNWDALTAACQSQSLFGDPVLVELSLATGRPGRQGGQHLGELWQLIGTRTDLVVLIKLPYLNRSSLRARWAQALQEHAVWIEAPRVPRQQLGRWIQGRLQRQQQSCDEQTAQWLCEQVEGHLLAAHQEILKLGLLYPAGTLSLEQIQEAVLDVARYNIFDLRETLLTGDAPRALKILRSLEAEGEPLPLVLWVVGEQTRLLAELSALQQAGQDLQPKLRQNQVFGPRQQQTQQALQRTTLRFWTQCVAHAYDIDQAIKGYPVAHRLDNPWAEITRLCMRIAQATA